MLTQRQRPAALLERELEACQPCWGVLLIIPDKKVLLREKREREERRQARGGGETWQQPSCFLAQASHRAQRPTRVCPRYKPSARWRKSTQRLPGEQTRPIALAAAPLSPFLHSPCSCPARNSAAISVPYFKQDFFFTLSLLCRLAPCQISKLIKRGMDWAYIFSFSSELLAEFLSC